MVLALTTVLAGMVFAISGADPDDDSATVTIIATLIQTAVFIGTAVMFASFVAKPLPWHFGLRRTRFWPALGWAALGLFAFYVFGAIYTVVVNPDVEQTVTQDLGADEGTAGLIAAGLVVIVLAPVAEEFFFRGFFYRALRNRLRVWSSCLITSIVFASLHLQYLAEPLVFLIIGVFAVGCCLVYEATGNLFTVIAIHAIFNTLATAGTDAGWVVPIAVGTSVVAACVLIPRMLGGAPSPFPQTALAR